MNPFRISVVLCTYNREAYIRRSLDSLIAQSLDDSEYEIIVIVDGSTDNTADIVTNEYADKYKNINALIFAKNMGIGVGPRVGIHIAKSPWIVRMDDDCIADKDWLLKIKEHIQADPELVAIEGKTFCRKKTLTPFTHTSINEKGGLYWGCNFAYKRETALAVGSYDDTIKFLCEDVDFAWKLKTKGKVVFFDDVLMEHPPRLERFWPLVSRMKHYTNFFQTYKRFPKEHLVLFAQPPWKLIYYNVFFKYGYNQAKKWLKYGLKNPIDYIKLLFVIIFQRLHLLYLFPKFVMAYFNSRNEKEFQACFDYTDEAKKKDAALLKEAMKE